MPRPTGFTHETVGDGVQIRHHGVKATMLRGDAARQFLQDVDTGDAQALMARLTGNYKRGTERTARDHPRNDR